MKFSKIFTRVSLVVFLFTSFTTQAAVLKQGRRSVDLASLTGANDFFLRFAVDPKSLDLYWARNGQSNAELVRVPLKNGIYDEDSTTKVADLGARSLWFMRVDSNRPGVFINSDEDNKEVFNVYRVDLFNPSLQQLTFSTYAPSYIQDPQDASLVFFDRGGSADTRTCLRRMRPEKPMERAVDIACDTNSYKFWPFFPPVFSESGDWMVTTVMMNGKRGDKKLILIKANGETKILENQDRAQTNSQPMGAIGDRLYAFVDDEASSRIVEFNLSQHTSRNLFIAPAGKNVRGFWSTVNKRIVATVTDTEKVQIFVLDPSTGNVLGRQQLPSTNFGSEDLLDFVMEAADGSIYASTAFSGNQIGVARISTSPSENRGQEQELAKVVFSPKANAMKKSFCKASVVQFPTWDNDAQGRRQLEGILFLPAKTTKQNRGVIWTHGGPYGNVSVSGDEKIELFCAFGYPVFAPNYRGSSGYGSEFEKLDMGDWAGGDYLDLVAAQEKMSELTKIPKARIGIAGHSFGGYLSNWAGTRKNSPFEFAISMNGMSDLVYDMQNSVIGDSTRAKMGDCVTDPVANKLCTERSPVTHVADITIPMLVIGGSSDQRCPIEQLRQFAGKAKELQKPLQYLELQGEGHNIAYLESKWTVYQRILDFLHSL